MQFLRLLNCAPSPLTPFPISSDLSFKPVRGCMPVFMTQPQWPLPDILSHSAVRAHEYSEMR